MYLPGKTPSAPSDMNWWYHEGSLMETHTWGRPNLLQARPEGEEGGHYPALFVVHSQQPPHLLLSPGIAETSPKYLPDLSQLR